MEGQVTIFDQDLWCGRMSPGHSVPIKEQTSKRSSRKSLGSQNQTLPMFLCLKKDGQSQGAYTMTWGGGALLGEYTMHSFGESPREENVLRLSQILEDCPLPKYSLSAKACQGILRRAEKRGKELPPELEKALRIQTGQSVSRSGGANPEEDGNRWQSS